ncbi:LysR family transcriptional regulator [Serratia marcescens]|uniref:DNA-binding transcriptional regulator, LysR family n=1 Tax=Serratia nematodiphila TaxID=458197 RepID=A0A1G5ECX3_9GAMM|nr:MULTISPECIES: LysR family transcriptional regulator [Serratia]KFF87019.1 LysR family transcriptional regulator [Serratia nematodiphila DZ0503SBS1]CAI0760308.1 D-malate degradation protein R [Serratia marcescens]CAI0894431.1 D-malate degradation protein R [Serratia marcescens]SCY24338.1 DNA-binding transcriptional regulator, LysR family [Serratia nematodiphila]BEO06777.1 LysR family transcriptional regulator [Serratia marcescens]
MEPELNDIRLFVEVARARSFRQAADAIGIPNPTLSRRVSALEKAIGLRLLHRTTRKVELTEAGQIYFERCRRIVDEARLAHEQLGEMLAQPSGLLRASFPVDFAVTYLTPLVVEFASRYPGITFDFDLTPRRVDLVSEPFDVAIRTGKPENSQLIARLLAELPAYLYASPRYLERMGEPGEPADLERHECLGILKATSWTLHDETTTTTISFGGGRFTLNSIGMIRQLAVLDMGIILVPGQLVADDLASGRLRQVLPQWRGDPVPVYAITETRLLPAKTQRFIEFLRERLRR